MTDWPQLVARLEARIRALEEENQQLKTRLAERKVIEPAPRARVTYETKA